MDLTGIVLLILAIAVIGFIVHLITTKVAMDDSFKQLIILIVVICIALYCLGLVTGHASLPTFSLRK